METTLYLIRHAEAEGNLYRRCHGWYDSALTENGVKQVGRLKEFFEKVPVDAVYASDLRRTCATAQAVVCKGLKLSKSSALREISVGGWEDRPWGELMMRDREKYKAFSMCSPAFELEDAETFEQVQRRIWDEVERIACAHKGQSVAVVSHGMALKLLMTKLKGLSLADSAEVPHLDNASVTTLRWGASPRIEAYGENAYLGDLSTFSRQSWWRSGKASPDVNLWFAPALSAMDLAEAEAIRRAAWVDVYGSDRGYCVREVKAQMEQQARLDRRFVQFVMRDGERVGLIQLSLRDDLAPNEGHITLVYLEPCLRGEGMGAQLLGEAVSVFRAMGKDTLKLYVWEGNERARRFYQKHGFLEKGSEVGLFGKLSIMKKRFDP